MSMSTYAATDYGVLLNGLGDEDGRHPDFDENILQELAESDAISYYSEFTGESFQVKSNGDPLWSKREWYSCDMVYYVAARRNPSLFKTAYRGMKALVDELCKSYEDLRRSDNRLPKLTRQEIRERIRFISGTYIG